MDSTAEAKSTVEEAASAVTGVAQAEAESEGTICSDHVDASTVREADDSCPTLSNWARHFFRSCSPLASMVTIWLSSSFCPCSASLFAASRAFMASARCACRNDAKRHISSSALRMSCSTSLGQARRAASMRSRRRKASWTEICVAAACSAILARTSAFSCPSRPTSSAHLSLRFAFSASSLATASAFSRPSWRTSACSCCISLSRSSSKRVHSCASACSLMTSS
mmetsp:Transcript_57505/g.136801  ORF Transcript_57505/g.136801 Transcript_57505/m.136801 type:complete len:225 (-) Transcript_57505:2267-2941(-)